MAAAIPAVALRLRSSAQDSPACRPPGVLAGAPVDVAIADRHNHHPFQPLLYEVATTGLTPAKIAGLIRGILRGQDTARVAGRQSR